MSSCGRYITPPFSNSYHKFSLEKYLTVKMNRGIFEVSGCMYDIVVCKVSFMYDYLLLTSNYVLSNYVLLTSNY